MSIATSFTRASIRWKTADILAGIIALGIGVRLVHLSHFSLWNDELFTRFYPDLFSINFLWSKGIWIENNPPLFYTLMAGWMRLFGTSEAALRAFSVLGSVLSIPLVYCLGVQISSVRVGLVAALLFAVSPFQIYFAQEARTYSLLTIPVSLTLISIVEVLRSIEATSSGILAARHRSALALYCLATVTAIYLHATMALYAAACAIVVAVALLAYRGPGRAATVLSWVGVNALIFLLALPEALAILHQLRSPSLGLSWIPPFTFRDIAVALTAIVTGVVTPLKFPGIELTTVLLLLLGFVLIRAIPTNAARVVIVIVPALFLLLISLASLLQPVLLPRTASWLIIPFCVAVALAVTSSTRLRVPILAAAMLAWLVGLGNQFLREDQKEPWREVLWKIGPSLASADMVVLGPFTSPTALRYYGPDVRRIEMWNVGIPPNIETSLVPEHLGVKPSATLESIVQEIKTGRHVWLLGRYPDLPWLPKLLDVVPPPRRRLDEKCGPVICLFALSW